jgi:ElaB/YqjD/DUF883 family membrane-anchored ribosome-binding protein
MSISTAKHRGVSNHRNHASRSNGDLKSLEKEAGSVLTHASGQAAAKIKRLKSSIRSGIAGAKARANNAVKAVRKGAARTDKAVRAKPYHAIAIAAGAGLLTGYLAARRRSNPS